MLMKDAVDFLYGLIGLVFYSLFDYGDFSCCDEVNFVCRGSLEKRTGGVTFAQIF